ncbi:MAG: hypothetical protein WBG73_17530 [Coleofasciculaceae cyanobacterium]
MLNAHNNLHDALYRQGDVLIKRVASLPHGAQKRVGATLAYGEVTGHSHRFRTADAVQLWVLGSEMFLEVKEAIASLIHEEHRTIELPQGFYRVWKQREYRPDAFVEVED